MRRTTQWRKGAFRAEASPESIAETAKFRFSKVTRWFRARRYSVKQGGQTIAKIIPRSDFVFVGIRDTKRTAEVVLGPLERVSIQGVAFYGTR
jgi:hypothetical protein